MKKYVAVLGRQPFISIAELESLYENVHFLMDRGRKVYGLAEFETADDVMPNIWRLGGTLKIAEKVELDELFASLPQEGKITLGVSDYSPKATSFMAQKEALSLKRKLVKQGRSVRVVENKTAVLSNATSLHNHLFADNKLELLKYGRNYYRVVQLSNIDHYANRDQKRPARDAKVGMLPPKLAQILINLCGDLPAGTRLLDPFCGTGVVLQEATLMGYTPYGTDINDRMVEYTKRNLEWLRADSLFSGHASMTPAAVGLLQVEVGDATSCQWKEEIGAVACEVYLGPPMLQAPAEIKLKEAKLQCKSIILGFLKNLEAQIKTGVPVVIAVPAWLRPDGSYSRLNLLDEIANLRYNVRSFKNLGQQELLYHRDGQVVAREIIVLRKR